MEFIKKRILKRIFIGIFSIVLFTIVVFVFLFILKKEPPVKEIQSARQKITQAKNNRADVYAVRLIRQSEIYYDSAMVCWKMENEKFFAVRDYSQVKEYAMWSAGLADQAKNHAIDQKAGLKSELRKKIDTIKNEITGFQPVFTGLPLPEPVWKENNKGHTLFSEAEIAFSKGQYILCEEKINEAERCISASYKAARNYLTDYFIGYHGWQEQAKKTIETSQRTKTYAIIVDKFSRQMFIYNSGKLQHTYDVELGKNWIGDKRHQGDQATPEGYYKITDKKDRNGTKYYKALLLNYPNEQDQKRFNLEKKNGTLLKSTEIGGSIEIHGNGGKGIDWTNGCIALKDSDMDVVYRLSQPGTMVTIVGSLKPLEEIIK